MDSHTIVILHIVTCSVIFVCIYQLVYFSIKIRKFKENLDLFEKCSWLKKLPNGNYNRHYYEQCFKIKQLITNAKKSVEIFFYEFPEFNERLSIASLALVISKLQVYYYQAEKKDENLLHFFRASKVIPSSFTKNIISRKISFIVIDNSKYVIITKGFPDVYIGENQKVLEELQDFLAFYM